MGYLKKKFYSLYNLIAEYFIYVVIAIIIVILLLCGYFFTCLPIINPDTFENQQILILGISLENWGIWYTAIGLIITAFWSIYQFRKSLSRKQQEKGAEISKLVSQSLLYKCSVLGEVIMKSELNKIFDFDKLKPSVFTNFDKAELLTLFDNNDEIFHKIRTILSSDEIQQIYFRYLEIHISQKKYSEIANKKYSDEEAEKLFKLDNINMPFKFSQLITSVLNDLEYICMYIASQNAGSKYIYQSLHQFFIRTVKILAPIICLHNKVYTDKYYINIIHVYNYWCELRNIDYNKELKKKEKSNKILNPKIKKV